MDYERLKHATKVCLMACGMLIFWLILAFLLTRPAYSAQIPEDKAILAIIGEAESEPWEGKVAVAETIRRRGSLKGIFGLNSVRVKQKKYTRALYDQCKRAWEASRTTNYSKGALGWGNAADVQIFKRSKWFRNCKIVKQIGKHYFWK